MRSAFRGFDLKGPQVAPRAHSLSMNDWIMLGWALADPWLGEDETGADGEVYPTGHPNSKKS